jgi:ornithine lipid ester-linked acyl 2-hydroxylase
MNDLPLTAYKVLTSEQMATFLAQGSFLGAPVDLADGYIHLSTEEQLQGTLDKHFAGQTGLIIAEIDLSLLGDTVRWERSRGDALFPHVYGELPMCAVISTTTRP